jgi:hypothetical protein
MWDVAVGSSAVGLRHYEVTVEIEIDGKYLTGTGDGKVCEGSGESSRSE